MGGEITESPIVVTRERPLIDLVHDLFFTVGFFLGMNRSATFLAQGRKLSSKSAIILVL